MAQFHERQVNELQSRGPTVPSNGRQAGSVCLVMVCPHQVTELQFEIKAGLGLRTSTNHLPTGPGSGSTWRDASRRDNEQYKDTLQDSGHGAVYFLKQIHK